MNMFIFVAYMLHAAVSTKLNYQLKLSVKDDPFLNIDPAKCGTDWTDLHG